MSTLADLIARVRVAGITGNLTPDLAREVLGELEGRLSFEERRTARDAALRAAAAKLPQGLPSTERARQLHGLLSAAARRSRPVPANLDTLEGCLSAALSSNTKIPGWRQIWNVLEDM